MTTLLARLVLWRIRYVSPEIAAQLKETLEQFNRRTLRWKDAKVGVSEEA